MSLVTTCPACSTSFVVTPEQLSAHRGDVRCGQCQYIFNALQQLAEVEAPPPETLPTQTESPAPTFEETATIQPAPELEDVKTEPEPQNPAWLPEPAIQDDAETEETELPQEPESPQPETLDTSTLDFEVELPQAVETPEDTETLPPTDNVANPTPEPIRPAEGPQLAAVEMIILPAEKTQPPSVAEPSASGFLAKPSKRRVSAWRLAPPALLLVLLALAQIAYFLRTEIAAHYPQARPWLVAGCAKLGCMVELPRQAELLSIEDSDLQDDPDHQGILALTSVLYNHAPYAQAYPLLEVTLTDTFDKPVLRRTLTPQEYLPKNIALAQGIAADGELHIHLNLSITGTKPAGYRLYVRY